MARHAARMATDAVGAPARPARPDPVDIEIEDIAHGLAFVARWNGQTLGDWPYSVAEHSLLVEEILRQDSACRVRNGASRRSCTMRRNT
jgi:hypothetical protein